jgi:hypothetical protein
MTIYEKDRITTGPFCWILIQQSLSMLITYGQFGLSIVRAVLPDVLSFGFAAWVQSEDSFGRVPVFVVLLVVLGSTTAGLLVLPFIEPLLVEPAPTPPVAEPPTEPDAPPAVPLAPAPAPPEPPADCAMAEVARPTARTEVVMILRSIEFSFCFCYRPSFNPATASRFHEGNAGTPPVRRYSGQGSGPASSYDSL